MPWHKLVELYVLYQLRRSIKPVWKTQQTLLNFSAKKVFSLFLLLYKRRTNKLKNTVLQLLNDILEIGKKDRTIIISIWVVIHIHIGTGFLPF